MKRIIAVVLVLVMSMSLLAGCGKFKCDECGEEKSGEKHEVEFFGEKATLCDDCKKEFDKEMANLEESLEGLEDSLSGLEDLEDLEGIEDLGDLSELEDALAELEGLEDLEDLEDLEELEFWFEVISETNIIKSIDKNIKCTL